jgi:hypothetical protein
VIDLRLLSALNDDEIVAAIADALTDGTISADVDGDQTVGLRLTAEGRRLWPPTLPATAS